MDWKVKGGKIAVIIMDWVVVAGILISLVFGIYNQRTIGSPFGNDVFIQWLYWAYWAFSCGVTSIKRIFGGHKVNGN